MLASGWWYSVDPSCALKVWHEAFLGCCKMLEMNELGWPTAHPILRGGRAGCGCGGLVSGTYTESRDTHLLLHSISTFKCQTVFHPTRFTSSFL